MSLPSLPTIDSLPSLPSSELTHVLDLLFEPSPPLHTLSLPLLQSQSFSSYSDLIASVRQQLDALSSSSSLSDTEQLNAILASHPRLGAKKVESQISAGEQAQLQGGGAEEAEQLRQLNEEYERTFPGLRYVVFVNGRPRPVIMEDMRRRIKEGTVEGEKKAAIEAMCEIANDRAKKLT